MAEQIITLDSEDDHFSIQDRLAQIYGERALVVLPVSNEPIRDRLGLVLMQRQARRLNIELGLVTTNPVLVSEARELGIPAVIGCVDATTRLKTGDRVLVDGGQGIVEILERA